MKKILSAIFLVILAGIVTGGYLVYQRYESNPEQIVPFPYAFEKPAEPIQLDAPILIAGDQMGHYMARFQAVLAEAISQNLDKPIRIQSIAKPGHGLHRTLHELKALTQWPQILIYQGASEEFSETKFIPSEITKIRKNFELYRDDRVETFLILAPWLSRLIYEPVNMVSLPEVPQPEEIPEDVYLKRLETELLLFEQQLIQLVNLSKDRNTLLILTTTPLNLDEAPRRVCEFTKTTEIDTEIYSLRELLKENNPKEAFARSSQLIKQYSGNAELIFVHGQIAKRLGKLNQAIDSLLTASAYDCAPWRATEIHNSIIRKVAKNQQVLLFDFAKLVNGDFGQNTTFFDELHPQNLYYDKGMQQLGFVIKKILKL